MEAVAVQSGHTGVGSAQMNDGSSRYSGADFTSSSLRISMALRELDIATNKVLMSSNSNPPTEQVYQTVNFLITTDNSQRYGEIQGNKQF